MRHLQSTLIGTTTLALALAMAPAQAVTQSRSFVQNATGACQSALPVYAGNIRNRPLAVQNEGTDAAFVNCSFMGTDRGVGSSASISDVYLYADNNTGAAVNVTCTLIAGYSGNPSNVVLPKTLSLPANSHANLFLWTTADNGGNNYQWAINTQCLLPVGTGLSITFMYYTEDVGA